MKIIIPMAGMGKRMRPHTLTIPKPLIPIAGKPIVQRLVEEISAVIGTKIDEIAFVIGDFGTEVEKQLIAIAESLGAKGSIYYQNEPLGTAHAVYCAKDSMEGNVIVAFADTLFKADFKLDNNSDAIIWVQKVDDPSAFGVVKVNEKNEITDFVEKPKNRISDLAIIGIYYFKDGARLKQEIKNLIDNKIMVSGEYQLTTALENMKNQGIVFRPGQVQEWLDCGNKNATVYTNQRILEHHSDEKLIAPDAKIKNSVIIPPCYIGKNAIIENSVIGPHVSIGNATSIINSVITNCIIQEKSSIENFNGHNSMIGNSVEIKGISSEVNIGDFTSLIK